MKIKTTQEKKRDNDTSLIIKRNGVHSNYEDFFIPPDMAEWMNDPLYLIIARWCMQQKRWVSRVEIQAVFRIPARRASFQFSYISRKKSRVVCRARYLPREEGGSQRIELWVQDILPDNTGQKKSNLLPAKKGTGGRASSSRLGSGMTGNGCTWEKMLKRVREGDGDE